MDKLLISNIQRMSFHDGPGIRTTIFLKACNLHCPWCANPENINSNIQTGLDQTQYGYYLEPQELYEELIKDCDFWGDDGGITFSGGEPLLQLWKLKSELERFHKEFQQNTVIIESALMTPVNLLEQVIEYIDEVYADIKILDKSKCSKILGGDIELYYSNLKLIRAHNKKITFRIPCSKEYTATLENIDMIKKFMVDFVDCDIEIFPLHNLGDSKWSNLGIEPPSFEIIQADEMGLLKDKLQSVVGNRVSINNF